jgi:ribose 5-phosphate isomerase A
VVTGTPDQDQGAFRKRAAARAAVAEIADGMLVGLGTGTTADLVIAALGERVAAGLRITGVATSAATRRAAESAGLALRPFDGVARLDLAIDGADEVDPQLRAIKGKGGAMLREKIVAAAAVRTIVAIDDSKQVPRLGRGFLPVEVLPFALAFVADSLGRMGATVSQRMAGQAGYRTEQDNVVLDCAFGEIDDCAGLAAALSAIPGVLGHGLFVDEIDVVYVGGRHGAVKLTRSAS